jgi:hypothetical protein
MVCADNEIICKVGATNKPSLYDYLTVKSLLNSAFKPFSARLSANFVFSSALLDCPSSPLCWICTGISSRVVQGLCSWLPDVLWQLMQPPVHLGSMSIQLLQRGQAIPTAAPAGGVTAS